MKHAEQVTFGGSGLNRAAHIRMDEDALAAAMAHPKAACVLLWRGKPLMRGEGELALVPMNHPILKQGLGGDIEAPVFLGLEESGAPDFACDISKWEPEGQDTGSLGMLPSASLSASGAGMYEPVHGTAPDIAGQDKANPLATILSVGMLFRYSLDMPEAADNVDQAVAKVLADGHRTADIAGADQSDVIGCRTMGELVIENL